ncbi:hypothetical protein KQX54_019734 [Cotesia glomerata]|uniref:Uncharacterized protein n=1 Tax=Cotesia glomerata TaxID=32391 RepID=A0AAV7IYD3_COTGL|nr:hypothetical protein KQX54_019734 [Cotesia glomerata]
MDVTLHSAIASTNIENWTKRDPFIRPSFKPEDSAPNTVVVTDHDLDIEYRHVQLLARELVMNGGIKVI